MRRRLAALGAAASLACAQETVPLGPGSIRPSIAGASVVANPANALSAVVTAGVQNVDSVAVRYHPAGQDSDSVTPTVSPDGDAVSLAVLGLLPDTPYVLRVVAYHGLDSTVSESLAFRTAPLPTDIPRYSAGGVDPSPGYVVMAAGKYGLVIDNTGRVVWYHRFPDGPGLNFMAQPNGRYVARPTTPDTTDIDLWVEIDPRGHLTRTFGCVSNLRPRFHDLIGEPDGGYWILCDETRVMDLSAVGGAANARVTGTVVQHVGPNAELLFEWNAFDHFALTDLDAAERAGPNVNWTHGNAITLDAAGDLLISFRSLNEITKVSGVTGGVLWRMGGLANQFTFVGTGTPAFARQHGVRLTTSGELLLLDNSGDPERSHAERYVVDEHTRTARLVQAYASTPNVIAHLGGTVQPLPGGRTLVAFGNGGRVEEFDASGKMLWEIKGNAGYVFRAQRIRSLYRPGVETEP